MHWFCECVQNVDYFNLFTTQPKLNSVYPGYRFLTDAWKNWKTIKSHLLQQGCDLVVSLVDAQILKQQTRARSFIIRCATGPEWERESCVSRWRGRVVCVCVRACVIRAPFESNYIMVKSREILFFDLSILHVSLVNYVTVS